MDNPFVQCPYNKEHKVSRSRIQQHIVRCEKRYPPLAICPYNATHRYPNDQIKAHVANCPSKQAWNIDDAENVTRTRVTNIPEPSYNDDGEEWDN